MLFRICVLGLLFFAMPRLWAQSAQSARVGDTMAVRRLLDRSQALLQKPGEEKPDLDSALFLAHRALDLSRRLHFSHGIEESLSQTGWVHIEAKRYDSVWNVLSLLGDSARYELLDKLIDYRINTKGNTRADFDSALAEIDLIIPLGRKLGHPEGRWLYQKTNLLNLVGEKEKSSMAGDEAFRAARRDGDIRLEGDLVLQMSILRGEDSSWDPQLFHRMDTVIADGREWLKKGGDRHAASEVVSHLCMTGYQMYRLGRMKAAVQVGLKAQAFNEASEVHSPEPYYLTGVALVDLGRLNEALEFAQKAISMMESSKDHSHFVLGYMLAGKVYYILGKWERSLGYLQKAFEELSADPGQQVDLGGFCRRTVYVYLKLNRPADALNFLRLSQQRFAFMSERDKGILAICHGDIYYALGQNEKAEGYFKEGLAFSGKMDRYDKGTTYFDVAKFYSGTGRHKLAMPFLKELTNAGSGLSVPVESQRDASFMLYQADSAAGDYRQAMTDLRQYQILKDSLFTAEKNRQLEDINARYETEKKDRRITTLNSQAQLQRTALSQTRLIQKVLIGGAVLLALLFGVTYNRYRLKQRTNRQLEQMNRQQQLLLKEKEWLMREVQHRVKNNLQIIASLLDMQTSYLKDEKMRDTLEDTSSRIRAISLVHQKLYLEGQDMTVIHMPDYIKALVRTLEESFSVGRRIRSVFDIAEMDLPVKQAIPIGLILNEAITNALKHAFPPGVYGEISVRLIYSGEEEIELVISDNGKGVGAEGLSDNPGTLGMQLIQMLSMQLGGTLHLDNRPGLRISLHFPVDLPALPANMLADIL